MPAAFNMTTGPVHWDLAFRMRALDQQCFVVNCSPRPGREGLLCGLWPLPGVQPLGDPHPAGREAGVQVVDIDLGTWPSTGGRSPSYPAGEATCTGPRAGRNPSNPTKERDAAMYYYNSAYTTYNYAAGALGILVVAVVLTALLLVLVLPKQKDGHLPAFFQLLYDLFTPKALMIERVAAGSLCVPQLPDGALRHCDLLQQVLSCFGRIVLGLVILVVGPVLLQVIHELLLLAVMQVKATREINQKLDRLTGAAPAGQQGGPGTETQTPAPPAGPMVHCTHCGTWVPRRGGTLPRVRHPAAEAGGQPIIFGRQAKKGTRLPSRVPFCCFEGKPWPPGATAVKHWIKKWEEQDRQVTSTFPTPRAAAWIGRRWGSGSSSTGCRSASVFCGGTSGRPTGRGPENGRFHLPLLLVFGQQADQQVHQHHGGRDHSGRKKRPKAARDQKEKEPKQAVQVKARVPLEKDFLGSATSATSWRVLQYLILYALSRQSVKKKVQEIGGEHAADAYIPAVTASRSAYQVWVWAGSGC